MSETPNPLDAAREWAGISDSVFLAAQQNLGKITKARELAIIPWHELDQALLADVTYIVLDVVWLVGLPECVGASVWSTLAAHHCTIACCSPIAFGRPVLMRHMLRCWLPSPSSRKFRGRIGRMSSTCGFSMRLWTIGGRCLARLVVSCLT